jgi:hypothetical protein
MTSVILLISLYDVQLFPFFKLFSPGVRPAQ